MVQGWIADTKNGKMIFLYAFIIYVLHFTLEKKTKKKHGYDIEQVNWIGANNSFIKRF